MSTEKKGRAPSALRAHLESLSAADLKALAEKVSLSLTNSVRVKDESRRGKAKTKAELVDGLVRKNSKDGAVAKAAGVKQSLRKKGDGVGAAKKAPRTVEVPKGMKTCKAPKVATVVCKTPKDSKKPKRKSSSWQKFVKDNMAQMKAEHPRTEHKKMMGLLAAKARKEGVIGPKSK